MINQFNRMINHCLALLPSITEWVLHCDGFDTYRESPSCWLVVVAASRQSTA